MLLLLIEEVLPRDGMGSDLGGALSHSLQDWVLGARRGTTNPKANCLTAPPHSLNLFSSFKFVFTRIIFQFSKICGKFW